MVIFDFELTNLRPSVKIKITKVIACTDTNITNMEFLKK